MAQDDAAMNTSIGSDDGHKIRAPVISVAMPVYNCEQYVGVAIESILAQTFEDFEFIIIDDGSTDNSLAILRRYEKIDSRIRLIARENRNLATTLNDIIDVARGEWVARMDQDDIAMPQRFAKQLEQLTATGADICGTWVKFFGTADRRILRHPETDEALKLELLFGAPFAHPTVMMRTDLVRVLRYDKAWEKCEDYDLWERAARAGWKMTNVPEVLLKYRQHAAQISTSALSHQQLLSQEVRVRSWASISEAMDLKRQEIDEVLKLREPSSGSPNIDLVEGVFVKLLEHHRGEAREVAFDHATRLYFRAAGNCRDIAVRWHRINKRFGHGSGISTIAKLCLLSLFRFDPSSKTFQRLKSTYFRLKSL
jgi:glycosyltransferase involved in cell wall biosynthesis